MRRRPDGASVVDMYWIRSAFIIRIIVTLCVVAVTTAAAHCQAVNFQFNPSTIEMRQGTFASRFDSNPVSVSVTSQAPAWRLYVAADNLVGPGGSIPSSVLTLIPDDTDHDWIEFLRHPTQITTNTLLASGGRMPGMHRIGMFRLTACIDVMTRPGDIHGNLHFYVDQGGGLISMAGIVPFSLHISSYTVVTLGNEPALTFHGMSTNAIAVSDNAVSVTVETNDPGGASLSLCLGELMKGKIRFPKDQTAIAYGTSVASALTAAAAAPFGQGSTSSFHITSPFGKTTYYIAGRVKTTPNDLPGHYAGQITFIGMGL